MRFICLERCRFGANSISIPKNYESRLIDAGLGLKNIEEGIVFLKETYSKNLPDRFKKEFLKEVELIKEDLEKI